ncbi:MAG: CsgG/HfaB family protein [Planctomycetota bacterium]
MKYLVYNRKITGLPLFTLYLLLFTSFIGCGMLNTSSTYKDDDSKCGIYPPPPPNFPRKRIAVIPFSDKTKQQYTKSDLGSQAVDISITLLLNAERFDVVEREKLDSLLAEQKLVGIVDPETAAKAGKILGADLIFTGAITDFEVKETETGSRFALPPGSINKIKTPAIAFKDKTKVLSISLAIDGRVIETETSRVIFAGSGEIKREEKTKDFTLWVDGANISQKGKIRLDQSAAGKQLRFALDNMIQKIIPKIDAKYAPQPQIQPAPVSTTPAPQPAAGEKKP